MKFSESAIKYFKEELNNSNKKSVEIALLINCCSDGYKLHIGLTNKEPIEVINGINVYYDNDAKDIVKDLTVDVKGDMILYE